MDDPRNRYAPQKRGAEDADLGQGQRSEYSEASTDDQRCELGFGPVARNRWLSNILLDPARTKSDAAVAAVVNVRLSGRTGTMFASLDDLARDASISRAAAKRAVRSLVDSGWLRRTSGHKGRANVYSMGPGSEDRVAVLLAPRLDRLTNDPSSPTTLVRQGHARPTTRVTGEPLVGSRATPQLSSYNSAPKPFAHARRLSAVERVMENIQRAQAREADRFDASTAIEGEFTRQVAQPLQETRLPHQQQGTTGAGLTEKQLEELRWINQRVHFGDITAEEGKQKRAALMQRIGGSNGQ